MTSILVTGAAGFIGRHLAKTLSQQVPDAHVIGLDLNPDMPACDRRIVCDLSTVHAFQPLQGLELVDYVIHLAAQSDVHFSLTRPDIYIQNNVLATSNLIQALANQSALKRFLLVSSCEVYGNTTAPATELDPAKPRTPYAASKLAQEFVALAAIDHQLMPTVVCRLFNNYGRGQQANRLIPRVMQALEHDRQFELIGDGTQTRDWVAVEDTCDALIRLLFDPTIAPGDVFNVASEEVYSVAQILELCQAAARKSLIVKQLRRDPGHLGSSAGSAEKLRAVTGWRKQRDLESFLESVAREMATA